MTSWVPVLYEACIFVLSSWLWSMELHSDMIFFYLPNRWSLVAMIAPLDCGTWPWEGQGLHSPTTRGVSGLSHCTQSCKIKSLSLSIVLKFLYVNLSYISKKIFVYCIDSAYDIEHFMSSLTNCIWEAIPISFKNVCPTFYT